MYPESTSHNHIMDSGNFNGMSEEENIGAGVKRCAELDEEDEIIMNADLLVTRSSERRRVLFYSNRSDLPYNLKILMKYNQHIEELAADEYFNRMVQFKNEFRDQITPSEAEATAAEKHKSFQVAVDSLCSVSYKLNSSLLDELEELKRGNVDPNSFSGVEVFPQ